MRALALLLTCGLAACGPQVAVPGDAGGGGGGNWGSDPAECVPCIQDTCAAAVAACERSKACACTAACLDEWDPEVEVLDEDPSFQCADRCNALNDSRWHAISSCGVSSCESCPEPH